MSLSSDSSTNLSLIGSLFTDPGNLDRGNAFLERYKPVIMGVINRQGIQGADAEDILQDVFQKMLKGFKDFNRRGSGGFRAWLRSIAFNTSMDWFNKNSKLDAETAKIIGKSLTQLVAHEYEVELMEAALRKARLEFHPRTWSMFIMNKFEHVPAKEVAQKLGVSVLTVYSATQRISMRLREIYNILDGMNE